MAMNDSNYTPINQDFTSGNLIYSPKQWADNELIERVELNNIEQGIQIALKQTDDIRTTSEAAINNMTSYYTNTILPSLNSFNTRMDGLSNEIAGYVETDLATNNSNIITTLQQIIGVTDYNIQSLPYSRPNSVKAIDTRITELYNEVFGQGSSGSTSSNSLNARLQALTTTVENLPSDISAIIGPRLGSAYYSNGNWETTYTDIDSRITQIYNEIFGQGSSSSNKTILEQIQDLNTAIFGSSSGGSANGSLINKIEKAMGRSLDLEIGETADSETGAYSNSLEAQINQIKGTLGMDGGTAGGTSSLINDVDTLLNLLYGYTVTTTEGNTSISRNLAPVLENLTITNNYPTLYDDFYNVSATYETYEENEQDPNNPIKTEHTVTGSAKALISQMYGQVYNAISSNAELTSIVESYENIIQDLDDNAYRGADIVNIGDETTYYLILKKDVSESDAESISDIENKTNTYLRLPAIGGGGGGTAYDLNASFINTSFPSANTITLGSDYIVGFTWQVTQEGGAAATVDGTLTIRLNNSIIDTLNINSNTPRTLNLGSYITASGRNNFVLTVTNVNAAPKSLYVTVIAYQAILTSSFNQEIVQTGSTIEFPYLATIGTSTIKKVLHIKIDNEEELSLSNNETTAERQNSVIFNTPSEGSHILQVWFTAEISQGVEISSNKLIYGILCGTSLNTRITSNFVNGQTIEQYNTLMINYMVVTPNQDETKVYIYVNDNPTPSEVTVDTSYHTWTYTVTEAAGTITIRMVAGNAEKIFTAEVAVNENYDFSMIESGLQLYLNANQRSNTGSNVNVWTNQSPLTTAPKVTCHLNNFLFYKDVDGWQQDEDGQYFLRLRNKATAEIDFPIYNFIFNNEEKITNGMTFEVDFKTQDVTNYDTEILSCYEQGNKDNKNIIFTAQSATIKNGKSLSTYFKEEEKITLDFVVNQSADTTDNNYGLFYIYINGILSAAIDYENTAVNFSNLANGKIVIGSTECTIDLYSIKYYNRALSSNEIIQNWIFNTGKYTDKIEYYNRNKYDGRVDFNNFIINSPKTPYMVITGPGDWNNTDGKNAMPTTKAAGTFDAGIKVLYNDPVHPELSFTTDFEGGKVGVAIQGTSSQEYERKNYKIKLTSFKQNGVIHNKKGTVNDENNSTEGYKLRSTSLPTWTFCIKADVASSESVNNTGLVQIYDRIVRNVVLTPPQADDERVRQGVEGYPMVTWYYNSITGEYTFLGKYNFNNDKGTEDVYGLEPGDESWEVGNNEKLLCFFDTTDGWEEWRTAFETRYPDDDDSMTKTEDPYTDEQIADRLAGLKEVVNWVSNTVQWTNNEKKEVTAASVANFKAGFENYFNLKAMTFFYVFTEFFLMVDNRAKNMFLTRYLVNNLRPEDTEWHQDTAVTNLVSNATGDKADYFGWFSLPYDMDTAIGINNVGVYTFDYHYEDGDYQPNGSPVFNGQKSKLWAAFRQAYSDEIRAMYILLQNNLSYTSVEEFFEQSQEIWSESVFNEDMIVKYIDWKRNKNDERALPMLLGSKKELRKWWLSNRFKYYNSKYALERASDNVALGLQIGTFDIPITVYADAYVTINVGAQDVAPITKRVLRGQTVVFSRQGTSGEGGTSDRVETAISPASSLRTIEGLSQMQLLNADFSKATKLQVLRIGSGITTNDRLTSVNVNNNSLLHLFDLRNCTSYTNAINLNNCLSLEYAYLSGTQMTSAILPEGGILTTIQYPTTINNITIINQPYLTNLIIGNALPSDEINSAESSIVPVFNGNNNYSNISALYLDNVGQIDSLAIVQTMVNTLNENNPRYLYLADIDWTMTTAEFLTLAEKILQMKGFNGTQPANDSAPYLGGILRLTTLPTTQEIEYIGMNFSNLKLYYRDTNGEDHEYYTVKFYDPYGAIITNKTQYIAAGNSASFNKDEFFTEEYLLAYNQQRIPGWTWGAATRYNFKNWDTSFNNVSSDLEIHPVMELQYRMDYVLQTTNANIDETTQTYIFAGEEITPIQIPGFERDYYWYNEEGWTKDSNRIYDSVPEDTREKITAQEFKAAEPEAWYAIYKKEPQTYYINIYTTDISGNKAGEPLNTEPIRRNVLTGGSYSTKITSNDVSSYLPTRNNNIAMYNSNEEGIADENRTYKFLSVKPYLTTAGISVTGNMDILITYYHKDDIFTNYFLNKIYTENLGSISAIPAYAFNHNTNLEKLTTQAESIGQYSFINFNTALTETKPNGSLKRRIFIFEGTNINFGSNCFQYLNNAIIVFKGSGTITIDQNCFNQIVNCDIIAYKTNNPIVVKSDVYSGFSSFTTVGQNNTLYVTSEAKNKYPTSIYNNPYKVPNNLISSARTGIVSLEEATANYQALLEEAGINDY